MHLSRRVSLFEFVFRIAEAIFSLSLLSLLRPRILQSNPENHPDHTIRHPRWVRSQIWIKELARFGRRSGSDRIFRLIVFVVAVSVSRS
ncbi:hypothetical protein MRB53_019216 [Persea americana]|uniref:Uncharacterized protein n=1 Tax=Persea americana TaxID=3435 RepID=A0ACC2KXG8_PERAE|nr:hypothetical protein MRB53_019216 [Persea americana]